MIKKLSVFAAFIVSLFFVPMIALASGAAEEAAKTSPTFIASLAVLSFVTIIYMIYLSIKDHG